MKGVAALLVLVTLLGPAGCMNRSPRASSGHAEALKTLDGKPVSLAELEASIEQAMKKANVAGLSVAIINDGQIAYTRAFGFRDKAAGIPFDTETVTGAASFSKPVFAYLVMLLVEEGVVNLDKPQHEYLSRG